ncbi:MAG: hypothetical protein SFY32_10610 [Bacteroidota bacterium]|nr:hypothetical protein [Bacteroidota bacterium]
MGGKHIVLYLIVICLTLGGGFYMFNFYQTKKENEELRSLLLKSLLSVDNDNRKIYKELSDIIIGTYYDRRKPAILKQKRYLDSCFRSFIRIDSSLIQKDLIPIAKIELAFNDSLISFAQSWSICNRPKYDIYDKAGLSVYRSHKSIYKYGDTAIIVSLIQNPPYFLENNFELIDFSPKEFGLRKNNAVIYSLPTQKFMDDCETIKPVSFRNNLIARNTYSNKIDTFQMRIDFTIVR